MSEPSQSPAITGVFHLVGRVRLRFTGADRLRYLNGQLTQDLKRLAPDVALPACVTSAKGRLQAEVWVAQDVDALFVDAPAELQEILPARLERYIVADDVAFEDWSERSSLLHCVGCEPSRLSALRSFPAWKAARLRTAGWDVWVPASECGAVLAALGSELRSHEVWEQIRVSHGIPAWGTELDENTLPPEAGLERTHIDYHKGCYIGQEVISRLKSVGHVNRSLCRFRGSLAAGAEGLPANGEELHPAGAPAVVGGVLTSVVADGAGGFDALGYIKRGVEGAAFETARGLRLERVS